MKFIAYNITALAFLALAGFLLYNKLWGGGWCIFGAFVTSVVPTTKD